MPLALGIGIGLSEYRRTASDGLAEVNALNARFSIPMSTPRKTLYQSLFASLRTGATTSADILSKLDALYIIAANDAQAAQRNIVQDLYNLTEAGTITFVQDRGYTGNGVDGYLETSADPTTLTKYAAISAHAMVWSRTDSTANANQDFGTASGNVVAINPRSNAANTVRGRINDTAFANFGAVADSLGMTALNRSASNARQAYKNGASIGSDAQNQNAFSSTTIRLAFLGPSTFSTHQLAAASFGASLSAAEHADLYSAVNTFLVAVGAA